jgi:hypothetical protein
MPRIIVMSNATGDAEEAITLDERIGSHELESAHRSAELIQRVGWAVHDADENEAATQSG